jgi:AGZA family xanthine/uracil permease-like MFS transporter
MASVLDKIFEVKARNSRANIEIISGLTTFLSMAYILFVNPSILTSGFQIALANAIGVSPNSIPQSYEPLIQSVKLGFTVATATAAGVATLIMALLARLPFGLAPGMGENAFIAFTVIPAFTITVISQHIASGSQAAFLAIYLSLVSVFFNGILFLIFSIGGIREAILNAIPEDLRLGISTGIGLFISFIGFTNLGIIRAGGAIIEFNAQSFTSISLYLGLIGFFLAAALLSLRIIGSFLISIITTTILGVLLGLVSLPSSPLLIPTYSTSILNDLPTSFYTYFSLFNIGFPIAFSLFLVDFFDGIGTITGLANKAGLVNKEGKIVNIDKALYSDAAASILASLIGTSTTVIYIESSTGIEMGGRSGLTSFVISLLFLASIPFSPIFTIVPSFATAPILILVGLLFLGMASKIKFEDLTETIPAFIAIISIPFTYSITDGIGLSFISYVVLKVITGRIKTMKPVAVVIAVLFSIYFALLTKL